MTWLSGRWCLDSANIDPKPLKHLEDRGGFDPLLRPGGYEPATTGPSILC